MESMSSSSSLGEVCAKAELNDAPTALPGEKILSKWTLVKLYLGACETHQSSWASLTTFYGFGTAYLTTCRLLFKLDPPAPTNSEETQQHISIPLILMKRDRLQIRHPFFDSLHVSGILIPVDITHVAMMGYPSFVTVPGKPMEFRLETLDSQLNRQVCAALHHLLSDPQRVARDTRVLRNAVHSQLIPTDEHYAFVDPDHPTVLHLTTQMAYPTEYSHLASRAKRLS